MSVKLLADFVRISSEAKQANERLVLAISDIRKAVEMGELEYETHYLVLGKIVYVDHPEGTGKPVSIVAHHVRAITESELICADMDAAMTGASS